MRRLLWMLGARMRVALLPLTGHIAFAAERPHTATTGTSATTDNLAEAMTNPAPAVPGGASGPVAMDPSASSGDQDQTMISSPRLGFVEQSIGRAKLMPPTMTSVTEFSTKLAVLSLVDHAPDRSPLPALVPVRLPVLNAFANLPAVLPPAGPKAAASEAETSGVQPVAGAASSAGGNQVAAPVSQSGAQPNATSGQPAPEPPGGSGPCVLPVATEPSPVTPLRLFLVLIAAGCLATAATTGWRRPHLQT